MQKTMAGGGMVPGEKIKKELGKKLKRGKMHLFGFAPPAANLLVGEKMKLKRGGGGGMI